jgi:hypothetical protein
MLQTQRFWKRLWNLYRTWSSRRISTRSSYEYPRTETIVIDEAYRRPETLNFHCFSWLLSHCIWERSHSWIFHFLHIILYILPCISYTCPSLLPLIEAINRRILDSSLRCHATLHESSYSLISHICSFQRWYLCLYTAGWYPSFLF